MMRLTARDVMSPGLVTMPPDTPVQTIARLFAERGVSAMPIVDDAGHLLGIVTETDLVRRLADEDDQPVAGWLVRLFEGPAARAERYARGHGVRARDVMTEQVVTIGPEESAAHVARLMEQHRIRRVVVVEGGKLLGMVSRSDLVRALLAPQPVPEGETSDERIRAALMREIAREPWADTRFIGVNVQDGVVEFHGFSRGPEIQRGLRVLAENVPGVREVVDSTRPIPEMIGT